MSLRQAHDSPTSQKSETSSAAATEDVGTSGRAEALDDARLADALEYIQRYYRFSREVDRLKLMDGLASLLFPGTAYVLGLILLLQGIAWLSRITGVGQPLSGNGWSIIGLFGFIVLTAGTCWLIDREHKARKRDEPQRIREIAARHGVDPDRPRMD